MARPQVGDEGQLGGVKGTWTERDGIGYYAFYVDVGVPTIENLRAALDAIRSKPPLEPKTWAERYVFFVDSIRRRLMGY